MREIKFRFWAPDKRMIEDHTGWIEDIGINEAIEASRDYGYTLMQFTGLKDKNGKEIYEGDIVKQEKWVSVGKYEPCIGVIRYRSAEFTVDCAADWEGSNADINGNAEVIGNIYENPELLL
jgi:uncharacterized phage protein (TIGR01671 family)